MANCRGAAYITSTLGAATTAQIDAAISAVQGSPYYNYITVMSWVFAWNDIQSVNASTYDWSKVDYALAATATASAARIAAGGPPLLSMLRIQAGQYAPVGTFDNRAANWLASSVTTVFFGFTNANGNRTYIIMAVPWDPNFVAAHNTFVAAFGARYNGDARVYAIQMPGAGRIGEMALGAWDDSLRVSGGGPTTGGWQSSASAAFTYNANPPNPYSGLSKGCGAALGGLTDAGLVAAWESMITAFQTAFPNTPTVLDIGTPLTGIYTSGPGTDPTQSVDVLTAWGTTNYPNNLWYQANGMQANNSVQTTGSAFRERIKTLAANGSKVGWQNAFGGATNTAASLDVIFKAVNSGASGAAGAGPSQQLEIYTTNITPTYTPNPYPDLNTPGSAVGETAGPRHWRAFRHRY